jgi:hypothetical protein
VIAAVPPFPPVNAFASPAAVLATSTALQSVSAGDPFRVRQYYLGQIGWAPQTGPRRPLVAVLDTGVDASHPDLRGVVDRLRSKSFVGGSALVDRSGHGTHMAGLIAAVGANGRGGVGVSRARIMSVKVATSLGDADAASIVAGINYAVAKHARVINISLGGTEQSAAERTAINRAIRAGIVVVAAAGNGGFVGDPVEYPAANAHVVAVGALTRDGAHLAQSTAGPQVLLSAPGESLLSTALGGRYNTRSGTSVATALVSGAAARIVTQRPYIRAEQVVEMLRSSATDVGPPGRDDETGAGRLNLGRALSMATPLRDRPEPDDNPWMIRTRPPALPQTTAHLSVVGTLRAWFDPSDDTRVDLRAGQRITVRAESPAGVDPDLVIWRPGAPTPTQGPGHLREWAATVAMNPGSVETTTFTAPVGGVYTVEVRMSFGGGRYRLTVDR